MDSEHPHTVEDHDDLLAACRAGSLVACEALVQRHHSEVLRTAFLLTGAPGHAQRLASHAFERAMRAGDTEKSFRSQLLQALGTAFLAGEGRGNEPATSGQPLVSARERYTVETQRMRVLAALDRLDSRTRTVIVLGDFNYLEPVELQQVLGIGPSALRTLLEPGRRRMAQSLDVQPGQPLRMPLLDAALDAPQDDLWPEIEGALAEHARRRRSWSVAAAVAVVALAVIGIASLVMTGRPGPETAALEPAPALPTITLAALLGGDATPAPTQTPVITADVPDMLLAAGDSHIYPLSLDTLETTPREVESGEMPVVARDGSQLFFVRQETAEGDLSAAVVAVSTDGFELQWEQDVAGYSDLTVGQTKTFTIDLVATEDRVYVARRIWQVTEPVSIIVLDRFTGEVTGRWAVDLSGPITGTIRLFTNQDGSDLYLMVLGQWPEAVGQTVYIRFGLPGMRLERRVDPVGGVAAPYFFFWDSLMLPDGSGLYRVEHDTGFGAVSVRFFDFLLVTARNVDLPFDSQPNSALPFQQAISHDGRWLYVFAPTTGQVALVDLQRRAVDRVVYLDMGQEPLPQAATATRNLPAWAINQTMRVSTDGARLYAIGVAADNRGLINRGVWTIDTTTWSLVDLRLPDVEVSSVFLHGGGGQIVAVEPGDRSAAAQQATLHALIDDGARSVNQYEPQHKWRALATVADLYRRQYGSSPAVAGEPQPEPPAFSSLPDVSIVTEPSTIATGGRVRLEVRLLDPVNGELIRQRQSTVRHDPDTGVTVILSREGSEDVIVILGSAGYGRYQGVIQLADAGVWDARLVLSNGIDPARQKQVAGVIAVEPALPATDGLDYVIQIVPGDGVPRAGTLATIRAEVVSASTGERIPEGVFLYAGIPEELTVTFHDPARGRRLKARLEPGEHGVLTGRILFRQPGRYTVQAVAAVADGVSLTLYAGSLEIRP